MNLFNRKNTRVVKPQIYYKESIGKSTRLTQIADKVARENPQYAGLLKEAKKKGKLLQALSAIHSGKLKLKSIKPQKYAYHGALPEKAEELKQKGLEARGIKEYKKKKGYNAEKNAAIYVFAGKVPDEYLYKGRVFSKEFEENLPKVKTTKTPQEQAINYPREKLDRINKQRLRKHLPQVKMEERDPSLVMVNLEELRKRGIGLAVDPEITGPSAKSYILVDLKTRKPIKKLDPKLMRVITPDKEKAMREARRVAEQKEINFPPYEQSAEKHFMSREEYEKYVKEKKRALKNQIKEREFEKRIKQEFNKDLDEKGIEDVIKAEEEKALKKLIDKRTLKKFLEEE